MNGLVSYSDDEETEIDPNSSTKEKPLHKNDNQSLNSTLGIKKASSTSSSSSTPIPANPESRSSNSGISTGNKSPTASDPPQSQLWSHSQVDGASTPNANRDQSSPEPLTSQTTLKALCFLPPKSTRNGLTERSELTEASKLDYEWGLGEEARGEVDEALQLKLSNFHALKAQGTHFNPTLSSSRAFRNPHIYSKLVNFVEVDERRSCYLEEFKLNSSSSSNSGVSWNSMNEEILKEGSKARLADLQKSQAEERQKAQASGKRSQIDFTSSSTSSARRDREYASGSSLRSEEQRKRDQSEAMKKALAARDSLGLKSGIGGREREKDRDRGKHRGKDHKDQGRDRR